VAKCKELLAENKQRTHTFHKEVIILKNLKEGGKEQYRFEVSDKFAALGDLNAMVELWEI
jgi:hypothetical protein